MTTLTVQSKYNCQKKKTFQTQNKMQQVTESHLIFFYFSKFKRVYKPDLPINCFWSLADPSAPLVQIQ